MRRSIGIVCFLGLASVSLSFPGTYPGFSFQTSETRNYPPSSYYVPKTPAVSAYAPSSYSAPSSSVASSRPVVRTLRSPPSYGPTVYISKAPLYYPEASVFSDPLPIVPLPQLPAEFLTLKTSDVSTGAYGGSENEVPKKSSKKARRGKSGSKATTPAPEDDAEEDEEEAKETDADDVGGYPASRNSQSPRQRQRSRQREQSSDNAGSGGYPSSFDASTDNQRGRSSQREGSSGSGGYPSSFDASNQRGRSSQREGSSGSGATGGYPSSVADDQNDESGDSDSKKSAKIRSRSRPRSRNNRPAQPDDEEAEEVTGEAEDDEPEMMRAGDDVDNEGDNVDAGEIEEGEQDDDADAAQEDEEEEPMMKTPPKTQSRSNKRGRGGNKKSGRKGKKSGEDDDESSDLSQVLTNKAQNLGTIYVPTFGNNVLNTVYPAFSQNALLRSLNSQSQSYPDSGQDVSGVSIAAEPEPTGKNSRRKSKKKAKKSRPASRSRSGRRGGKKNNARQSASRAQEPNTEYGAPQGRSSLGQQQQYGAPQQSQGNNGGFSNTQQQYGAPAQSSGISPPLPQGTEGGYRTINNEMRRGRTSDPPQFRQQPQQEYGAPQQSSGGGRFIEPRQRSQGAVVGNQVITDGNGQVSAELIRTVQAILEKYPN